MCNIFYCVSLQTMTGCHKNLLLVIREKCDVIQYPVLDIFQLHHTLRFVRQRRLTLDFT